MFWHDDVSELEKEAARHRQRGFRRVKMRLGRNRSAGIEPQLRPRDAGLVVMVMSSLMDAHRYSLEEAGLHGESSSLIKRCSGSRNRFPPEDIDNFPSPSVLSLQCIAGGG